VLLMPQALAPLPFAPTRVLFFTGKGGVGKTSLACALAIRLADEGRRVLLVSTDPASNLDEVLGTHLADEPRAVAGVAHLEALNIDPESAARAYRERIIGPYRHLLPASAVARMEESLSGACTVEIAAFDQFTQWLTAPGTADAYDHVVFDTAPTGHTLRLLTLPAAWDTFITSNTTGTSCLGPLSGLQAQHATYRASLDALRDPHQTTMVLVSRPDAGALSEADRTRGELEALGVRNQRLVVNAVFRASEPSDVVAAALEARGRLALSQMPAPLATLPRLDVPMLDFAPIGSEALRRVFGPREATPSPRGWSAAGAADGVPALATLIDAIATAPGGVVLTMGKGGVGKTTMAAAIALELARRGLDVHLSTTDPAAHLDATLAGDASTLTVSRIDPAAETRAYAAEVLGGAAALDPGARAVLEEDLRSPCTEEIAVFRAFARTVAQGAHRTVVLDTAPTGHTLLLLDAAEAYHREVARTRSDVPDEVRALLPRLRDPRYTRVLIVTLPEATPVHEAAALQDDLRRAGIEPFAWVVNQSFAAESLRDPVLCARAIREAPYLEQVRDRLASAVARVPWMPTAPVGRERLLQLASAGPASVD
jgi:arsenite-transporting ATPase